MIRHHQRATGAPLFLPIIRSLSIKWPIHCIELELFNSERIGNNLPTHIELLSHFLCQDGLLIYLSSITLLPDK